MDWDRRHGDAQSAKLEELGLRELVEPLWGTPRVSTSACNVRSIKTAAEFRA